MKFRPCIDIHQGQVKQIVGGSLIDGAGAKENFVSDKGAAYYANLYKEYYLTGGHIILLDPSDSEYYKKDIEQARTALEAYPGGLQIGGGVTLENAADFLEMGASHIIVTSYIFCDGSLSVNRLDKLMHEVGKEHIVLDLSCRVRKNRGNKYYVVTGRWQNYTETEFTPDNLKILSAYCDEFLIHGVDAEGKRSGIEKNIVELLGSLKGIRSVYAGGISTPNDIAVIGDIGRGKVDFTVGSALDIFGGDIPLSTVLSYSR